MDRKFASVFVAIVLPAVLAAASAYACDEPGTPTNVTARPVWNFNSNNPDIVVNWTNTADETVWWDNQVTDGEGRIIPQRAGVEPHSQATARGLRITFRHPSTPYDALS